MIRNLFIFNKLRVFLWVSAIKFTKYADFEDKNGVFLREIERKKKMIFEVVYITFQGWYLVCQLCFRC